MLMARTTTIRLGALLAALAWLAPARPAAAQQPPQGTCGPIYAAGEKRIGTPHHIYTTQTQDGTTRTGEIVSTADGQFILVQGQWLRSPLSMTPQEALEDHRERFRSATVYSCTKLRTEAVDGVSAIVYQMHSETDEGISNGQVWIAARTGLPIKQEVDLEVLVGPPGKSHTSARFDYRNVQTPAVAPQ
jgi:hypothetical protein